MLSEARPLLNMVRDTPKAPWADAVISSRNPKRLLPQAIGHRGFKARYPENTILAFDGAVEAGAHAIETDVHLTADGVVVLSHDPTGKRCYGVNRKIRDCTWETVSWWRTLRQPHQPMPRLEDALTWLAQPKHDKIWLLLDIKVDDPAVDLVSAIAKVLDNAPCSQPWDQRIVLGCWNATFTTVARRLLPTFPLAHISISPFYSRHFFRIPGMGMNMHQRSLIGPIGWFFMRKVRKDGRQLFVWTVNSPRWMEWCLRQNVCQRPLLVSNDKDGVQSESRQGEKLIDGVITDDPELFLKVCKRWENEQDGMVGRETPSSLDKVKQELSAATLSVVVQIAVMLLLVRNFYLGRVDFFKREDALP